ncbi:MAG: sensor domain-containing diguanylate cyclase [Candidatus Eremiobacteraeota bacterium]|nr:sensor domain-containing diguanylate cyclase [Candidatus Eremiobacteraeota bacterium]
MKKIVDTFSKWSIMWRLIAFIVAALYIYYQAGSAAGTSKLNPLILSGALIAYGVLSAIFEQFARKMPARNFILIVLDILVAFALLYLSPSNMLCLVFSLPILNGFRNSRISGYYLLLFAIVFYTFGGIIFSIMNKSAAQFLNPPLLLFSYSVLFLSFIAGNLYCSLQGNEEKTDALIALVQVGQELGTTSSLQQVLSKGINIAKTLFPCHSCVIYMKSQDEKDDPVLRVKAYSAKIPELFVDFNVEITPSIIGKTIKEKVEQRIDNYSADPREDVIPKDKGLRAMMIAPLMMDDRVMGIILIAHTLPGFYGEEDLKLFSMLANQIALAVRNIQIQETMGAMAITDSLSGLFTHGFFQENLAKELTKAKYENKPLSFMIIDVDFFKKINDTYGHPQGDALLKQLGGVFRSLARKGDVLCRYGGDEFTVTMLNTNRISAVILAEKIRTAVEEYEFVLKGQVVHITISGGVGSFPEDAQTKKELIDCADKAMYQSKQGGRNKISFGASKK